MNNDSNALELIERLRKEQFNIDTEQRLESHPYIKSAENGSLTLEQRQALICEQLAVQHSDAVSFARLAGQKDYVPPKSLAKAKVPEPVEEKEGLPDLFQFLLSGEIFAAKLLLNHAKSLNLPNEQSIASHRKLSAGAQAYPSYWARLSRDNHRAAAAAACAVNFPAWSRMCARLLEALATNADYGYSGVDDERLAFIKFFATPIDNLDAMAAAILEQEDVTYDELVEPVRLLQEYEIMFWDSIYDAQ